MSEHPCKYCGHWPDPTDDFSYVAVCNGETFCGEPVCRGKCYQCQNKSLQARIEALEKAAQRRVDCGHDDECGGRQKDRCGCGHTELENALEMLLP